MYRRIILIFSPLVRPEFLSRLITTVIATTDNKLAKIASLLSDIFISLRRDQTLAQIST